MVSEGLDSSLCLEGEREASERGFGEEQRSDPSLRGAWDRASLGQGSTESGARLILRQGILYRVGIDPKTKEEVNQLVLPASRWLEALKLTHNCPLGGHMGEAATTAHLLARVYWLGLYRNVRDYCASCSACQRTRPKKKPGGPLQPMPVIQTPFERVAIDLVGPLPKGKGGTNTY